MNKIVLSQEGLTKTHVVVCADETWNRPKEEPAKDLPTYNLKLSRASKPCAEGRTLM